MKNIFIITKKHIYVFLIIILFILLFSIFMYSKSISTSVTAESYTYQDLCEKYLKKGKVFPNNKQEDLEKLYNGKEKIAYLTFDDGPTKRCTPKILDVLKSNNIKATFFVIGERVEQNPDIVKREFEEGHYIANHTYSHSDNKIYNGKESFYYEILKTEKAISNAIGVKDYYSHLFRFPCGSSTNYSFKKPYIKFLKEFDYCYLDWNCLNNDAIRKCSNYELLNTLKKTSKNKETLVILMHDSGDVNKTNEVLQDSIDYLKSQGYTFGNMKDIIQKSNHK